MKKRKVHAAVLPAILMSMTIAACGSSEGSNAAAGETAAATVETQAETTEETAGDNASASSAAESRHADEGRGDLIRDDGNNVPVLMGGALPFSNMQTLESVNNDDGTYYYSDITEDGQIIVINTVYESHFGLSDETFEDYMIDCALTLTDSNIYEVQDVDENETYCENMSYPVYIVKYTAGENEDTREWTVFVCDTDRYTYLYGFCATPDAEDDMDSVYQDIFAGLYLSD